MKYIPIPETIPVYNLTGERMKESDDTDAEVTFANFVLGRLGDPAFAADMQGVIAAVEIKKQLDDANGLLQLENDHWQRLKGVTETPSPQTAYHPAVAHNLLPFMKAICDATDSKPSNSEAGPE